MSVSISHELVIAKICFLRRTLLYKHCTAGYWQHSVCENKSQRGKYKFLPRLVFSLIVGYATFVLKQDFKIRTLIDLLAWHFNGGTSVEQSPVWLKSFA